MTKRLASLAAMVSLALGIAAFTGSALAGNGNGNGTGKDTTAAPTAADKGTTAQSDKGSASQNAGTEPGVKPTNATAKDTTCSTGGGQGSSATCKATGTGATNSWSAGKADSSKKYGHGKTAAQIANSRGAPANTTLKGPGNSQPHKVWDCRRQHWVDVHAVKSYSTASCSPPAHQPPASHGSGSTGGTTSHATTGATSHSSNTSHTAGVSHNTQFGGALGATATGSGQTAQSGNAQAGGVLGVTASGGSKPAGGVLGAIEVVRSGVLPFTGFPLWIVVLAGAVLLTLGLTLRPHGRATA
jgi:hypothetical protein